MSVGTSASTDCRVSAGILSNAELTGANTVNGPALFSVSPRLAAVTAATSVDSSGLLLAAVPTGSAAMPADAARAIGGHGGAERAGRAGHRAVGSHRRRRGGRSRHGAGDTGDRQGGDGEGTDRRGTFESWRSPFQGQVGRHGVCHRSCVRHRRPRGLEGVGDRVLSASLGGARQPDPRLCWSSCRGPWSTSWWSNTPWADSPTAGSRGRTARRRRRHRVTPRRSPQGSPETAAASSPIVKARRKVIGSAVRVDRHRQVSLNGRRTISASPDN